MQVNLIAAMSENRVIGKDNRLPWSLPDDLKRFRELTRGRPVIMGRRTYDSIGRPLPQRTNIVVTRDARLQITGCTVVTSVADAVREAERSGSEQCFVIGGEQIYRESLAHVGRIYLTLVHTVIEDGDAFFPEMDMQEWKEVSREEHPADERHAYPCTFLVYERV